MFLTSEKTKSRMNMDTGPPRKAWEPRKFEHLRWSFPEAFSDVKKIFNKRAEWRLLEPGAEDQEGPGPQMSDLNEMSHPKEFRGMPPDLLNRQGMMGTMLARAFQRRETLQVARKKYLGPGDDGGKGRQLFDAVPTTFEESGSIVPQRALRVRQKFPVEVSPLSEAEIQAAEEAKRTERDRYWKERKKLQLITARRHTSRKRKPNGGFYSSDVVAGKIWDYYTPEYESITSKD